jgi:hypothetical protein
MDSTWVSSSSLSSWKNLEVAAWSNVVLLVIVSGERGKREDKHEIGFAALVILF